MGYKDQGVIDFFLCHSHYGYHLFSSPRWLHLMADLFVFLRISLRKTGITVVWKKWNYLFFFPSCDSPPSLTSPLSAFTIFGLYRSNLFPSYKLQPPLLRKRQQSCGSMKRASHVKSECTSCASTSKAGCVGMLLRLTRDIRDACLQSFPVVWI